MKRPSKEIPSQTDARREFKKGGCPHCGPKGQVEGEAVTIKNDTAVQDQNCVSCGNTWTAFYDLGGVRWYSKDGEGNYYEDLYTRKREGR